MEQPDKQQLDELVRRALKTPPISNEEIERRSKANGREPRKPENAEENDQIPIPPGGHTIGGPIDLRLGLSSWDQVVSAASAPNDEPMFNRKT